MALFELHNGDCLEYMRGREPNSIDTIICDPPYGLSFMGKDWDHGIPGVPFWHAALRVAKPGAMMLAFGGTRTHHRLMCAIEDAGWEIRDCMMWLYGSGFPKSHDISKGIDKAAGVEGERGDYKTPDHAAKRKPGSERLHAGWQRPWMEDDEHRDRNNRQYLPATNNARDWQGWGTALKPAYEPIIMAMKPLDGTFAQNAIKWGVAGLNVEGGRIGTESISQHGRKDAPGTGWGGHWHNELEAGKIWSGRWPANLILDEEAAAMLDEQSGTLTSGGRSGYIKTNQWVAAGRDGTGYITPSPRDADTGGASRFFYCAKASRSEREQGLEGMTKIVGKRTQDGGDDTRGRPLPVNANHHPTVKPLALMRYLVRLTATPTGGIVFDPFMGSGTTGIAAIKEGRGFIGCELQPEYFEIAKRRIEKA